MLLLRYLEQIKINQIERRRENARIRSHNARRRRGVLTRAETDAQKKPYGPRTYQRKTVEPGVVKPKNKRVADDGRLDAIASEWLKVRGLR